MNKTKRSYAELQQLPYIRVQDCPTVTGLSQGFVRELIRSGTLPVAKRGRCIFVNKQLLLDTVAGILKPQTQAHQGE